MKRKRKVGKYYKSPYTNPPDTTPIKLWRRSSRINNKNISPPAAPDFDENLQESQFEPFTEVCDSTYIFKNVLIIEKPRNILIFILQNLSRAKRSKPTVVSVPAYFRKWLKEAPPNTLFYFPWGDETVVDRRFWECIVGTGAWSSGWLRDEVRINLYSFVTTFSWNKQKCLHMLVLLINFWITCVIPLPIHSVGLVSLNNRIIV